MALALFDLDNTLLGGDSDHLWGEYLVELGVVDGEQYRAANDRFYQQYRDGLLDIDQFLAFALRPLSQHPLEQLEQWHAQFMRLKIEPIVLPAALELVAHHRSQGDQPVIITATNRFVTAPIAARFGVDQLIATEPEFIDGSYSGRVAGVPCFREGKVTRLRHWLQQQGLDLSGSSFYSDSHNDLPLLEQVSQPVAVDPDPTLAEQAQERGWPIISLRG
ncbi:MAG: HAD-IB family hydrolase [Gammaproteobacteria bacterium SHHR-1]|uniref:histidinol-phosphatase n=1 Tax=Magnetovirga frankeli TaxID=947516 RepID=UPI001293D4B6|nr:HAD family hydrolase [gamma proteobacterium SS-5]